MSRGSDIEHLTYCDQATTTFTIVRSISDEYKQF